MDEGSSVTTAPARGWAASAPPPASHDRCARHPEALAAFACDRCKRHSCALCVKAGDLHGVHFFACECGGRCVRIEAIVPPRPLEQQIGEAFTYPARGEGRGLLAIGTAFFGLLDMVFGNTARQTLALIASAFEAGARTLDVGFMRSATSVVILVLLVGTLLAWVLRIVRASANGNDQIPGFGEFRSAGESMVLPIVRTLVVVGVTIGPAFLVLPFGGAGAVLGLLLLFAGAAVLPMALTAVAIADSLEGLDARRILRSIPRIGVPYFFAAALFLAVIGLLFTGAGWVGAVPWIGPFLRAFLTIYLAAVAGRVLGLLYAQHAKSLGWY